MTSSFRLVPVVLSLLVLAAHFLRQGNQAFVVLVLVSGVLLAVPRIWAARTVQTILVLGALEWVRTLVVKVGERASAGQPVTRLAVILGTVALVTGASALALRGSRRASPEASPGPSPGPSSGPDDAGP